MRFADTVEVFTEIVGVDCVITIEYDAYYLPAKINAPMEDCYPEESDMEWRVASLYVDGEGELDQEDVNAWVNSNEDLINSTCWEAYYDQEGV